MKKIIYSLLMMVVLLPSCLKDDKDIFDKSSADRMTEAMKEYQQALESSPNGWLMSYYPGRDAENEVKAGYNYLVKFKNGEVTAAADFSITNYPSGTEISSLYRIIADEGPVLTFDSYNNLLHNFCTPSSSTPYGSRADYEFTILSASSDSIVLRGKLYRNKIYMTPIPQDETWAQCLTKIESIRSVLSNPLEGVVMTIDNNPVDVEKTARGFTLSYTSNEGTTKSIPAGYRCIESGIQFYKPLYIHGKYIQNFKYENGKFVCTDGVNAEFKMERLSFNRIFAQTDTQWIFDIASSSTKVQTGWTNASVALAGAGEVLDFVYIGNSHIATYPGRVMVFQSHDTQYWYGLYTLSMVPNLNTTNEISFTYIPGSMLNEVYYKSYYLPFINLICNASPYTITPDDETNPSVITFVSKTDPSISFIVE